METTMSPTDLRELLDRQEISALLFDFAHRLDSKDWQGYADNFADEGVLVIPASNIEFTKDQLVESVSRSLGRYAQTVHYSTNHRITLSGDTAQSRSYLLAIHIFDSAEPHRHADQGGWYDCDFVRTSEGWKFRRVFLETKFFAGEPKL